MYRAENVISEEEDVRIEKDHIRKVFSCNESFEIPKKKQKAPPPEGATVACSAPIGLI